MSSFKVCFDNYHAAVSALFFPSVVAFMLFWWGSGSCASVEARYQDFQSLLLGHLQPILHILIKIIVKLM